ncbi:MAG: hypothetical protein ACW990_04335 [Promethearchaeota archaeon]|jgi:hypothetical protein
MDDKVIDAKLKLLVYACKQTQNFKKLAVVSFILTSNEIDKIGLKLGVKNRNKKEKEPIFEYMEMINQVFANSVQVEIFREELVNTVQECELIFIKNRGELPFEYIKSMFRVYYTLRKLRVPDLNLHVSDEKMIYNTNMNVFSYLHTRGTSQVKGNSKLTPLIMHKLQEQENILQQDLQHSFDAAKFEKALYLTKIKNSLASKNKNKIFIEGPLKDNLIYQYSVNRIFGYYLLGLSILLLSLGVGMIIEMSFLPLVMNTGGLLILLYFGAGGLLLLYYIKRFKQGR